ncbi:MAG: hypothetical protein ACYDH6_13220 [Acidimicrobiales bacterium]
MAQPAYVPVVSRDRVRVSERLPTPDGWVADRPAEVRDRGSQPAGPLLGVAGPDQGYALKLARHVRPKIIADNVDDAVAGAMGVALRRAALFGRAPVVHDLDLAFTLFGFYSGAPAELIAYRRPLFAGVSHDYQRQREITDRVPDTTLRLTPLEVTTRLSGWRDLIVG